jgi:hypothetical protein
MALGAANKQQMQPAQYVNAVNNEGLFRPGNFSSPNVNFELFQPQQTIPLVQSQMQQTTRDNVARQALQDGESWGVLERMQSALEKSQPNLERIKYNRSMDMQYLLNNELNTINELYSRAYKGDMNAQEQLTNFTFRNEILEGATPEQFNQLKQVRDRAQASVLNSTILASSQAVKKDFAVMIQNLTSENNPDSKYVQGIMSAALVGANAQNRALSVQELEAMSTAINGYKAKYPKSKAVDSSIVDNVAKFKTSLVGADKQMLDDQMYGDGRYSAVEGQRVLGALADALKATTDPQVIQQLNYQMAQTLQRMGYDSTGLARAIADMGKSDEEKKAAAAKGLGAGAVMQNKLK